jgi:PAS domain S-box-containing protein
MPQRSIPGEIRMQQQIAPGALTHELFDTLIDQLDEEILIVDSNDAVLALNARLLESWGGTRADYLGKPCASLDRPELNGANSLSFFDMVKRTGKRVTETYTDVAPDGRMNYYHVNAFPLRDKAGDIRGLVLARRNTTAEMQIEQRLYQSQKMASIGELSTYIAHEIRNPLFAIGGFANALLRAPGLDESAQEKARIILEESKRLDDILKSIINFARPTEQTLGDVEVNAVAAQTVEIMGIGTEKNIPIVLELARNMPKAYGNAEMLKQCLINLIKNAQEAMAKGTIHVRTRYLDATVYLEVEDDGPGIPQELQEQIFSPFFSTKDKGAGLGLAMTRKILNEIGGKLILHSKVGHGTLVSLALKPVLAVAEEFAEKDPAKGAR